jgi:hypothetical protein
MEAKFNQAVEANGKDEFEQAYNLFKDCYENNYKAAECAGSLGLIAFNHLKDIQETRVWFNRAVNQGSKEPFVYLYLVEIYQGSGKTCPREYYNIAHSRNTELNPDIIRKIRTMCGESPSNSFKYKFD